MDAFALPISANKDIAFDSSKARPFTITSWENGQRKMELTKEEMFELISVLQNNMDGIKQALA